jgi:ATPase subunit of ABC transporter with duplicated ATPase domains
LQVQFEEMSGWSADSDAAAMLSNLGIGEEHHFTLMADLEAKLRFVFFWHKLFWKSDLLIMDEPTNDLDFETIEWLENFLANYENTVIVVS